MTGKIKGIYKSFKYITQIFVVKEREMEIGYPTDVKHVAHIGWDGPSGNGPSWMNDFETAPDFSTSLGNLGGLRDPNPMGVSTSWSSQDFEEPIGSQPTPNIYKDSPSAGAPRVPKKPKRKKNQWSKMFCGIVSRATTLEVLSKGVAGNYNGAMQVMSAEFQVPTPLVVTREYDFVRYCKQHPDGSWAVVDVSLDHLRPGATPRCRRRPSGCLIQQLPNGYSKVTWIEHVEVDDKMLNNLYKPVVNSGFAFGAKRWVASLERQLDRLASTMITTIPPEDPCVSITGEEGRKAMLTMAGRMMISFCTDIGASTAQAWKSVGPACDNVRIMTRKIMHDPGRPSGIVLYAATSLWLPVPPKRVFDFLRNVNSRRQWDILSERKQVFEMAQIANGLDPDNCVSILQVNNYLPNAGDTNMVIMLQESCTDPTGSYVVYAPIDVEAINKLLSGGNPNNVALLPSGFAIFPDNGPGLYEGPILEIGSGGSLLTVAFQILVASSSTENVSIGSVASVNGLLKLTVEKIKAALMSGNTHCQF